MILIVTNKSDYTADYLILGLKSRGIRFFRLNTEDFPCQVGLNLSISSRGDIEGELGFPNGTINIRDISSIWYRRPVPSKPAKEVIDPVAREFIMAESQEALDALWRLLPGVWVSHPDKLRVAESKPYQLQLAARVGFTVPKTLITTKPDEAEKFYNDHPEPTIYKPLRRSRIIQGDEVKLIYTNVISEQDKQYFDNIRLAPVLMQPYIPKLVEIRVTVVGSRAFAIELHSQEVLQARHDWRRVNAAEIRHKPHLLPSEVEKNCVELVKTLGLNFGAIDLILTPKQEYVFLELNPNGQWAWIQQLLPETKIREELIGLLVGGGNEIGCAEAT